MEADDVKMDVNNAWNQYPVNEENEKQDPPTFVDCKILRMMNLMGYQSGLGLGKNQQGIINPVTLPTQLQRRGLGLKSSLPQWDYSLDNSTVKENVEWLNTSLLTPITVDPETWPKETKPIVNINEETNFCDREILHDVITAKDIFDQFDLKDLNQARTRANPFETIRSVFFMNRAALKMANIDAATDFMFTDVNEDGGVRYFADVCAGPGGFTEYVLWRKKWQFKGFGFTLRGEHDFKLNESVCASPVTFLPLYGAKGDGDVCCPPNIDDFREKVLFETGNKGVHFVMSDGGFSVEGNENLQEVLSKNIYICQCLVALEILRRNGHFVVKMFDLFTCFSVGLLYLMCHCFEKVCILKPNSSRPANSERYVICSKYKGRKEVKKIRFYLKQLVHRLWDLRDNPDLDITEIVPLLVLQNDHNFFSYVYSSNNRMAKSQTLNLRKLATFCENPSLVDHRQYELRKSCLEHWKIPDEPKVPLPKYTVDDLLQETIHNRELFLVQPREIHSLPDLEDCHCVPMQCRKNANFSSFYAGVGISKAYRLQQNKWVKIKNLQLPRGTLLYGELVKEKIHFEDEIQHKYSLHVIDALRLGDVNFAHLNFEQRQKLIDTFCRAVNHEFRMNTIRVRAKIRGNFMSDFVCRLPVLAHGAKEESYEVNSFLFLKTNQSFHVTYVLRMQYFVDESADPSQKQLILESLNVINKA